MSAISALRIQTLTRRLNKCELQMQLLNRQHEMLIETTSTIGREYTQLYTQINGLGETVSAEYKDAFSDKAAQLQEVYFIMYNRENDLELELKDLNTEYELVKTELKNMREFDEKNAKKEVAKFG